MQKKNYSAFRLRLIPLLVMIVHHEIQSSAYAMQPYTQTGIKRKAQDSLEQSLAEQEDIMPPLIHKLQQDNAFFQEGYLNHQTPHIHDSDSNGNTPLHWISCSPQGNSMTTLATELIRLQAPIDAKNKNNMTPLHLAIQHGHHDLAQILIDQGANLNLTNQEGRTPLLLATLLGHTKRIQASMEQCIAEIQSNQHKKASLFHAAAERGHLEIIQAFIQSKVNLEVEDSYGNTPLHFAMAKGRSEIARTLMDHEAHLNVKNQQGQTPFLTATLQGQTQLILTFLDLYIAEIHSHPKNERSLVHAAAETGNLEIIQALIQEKVNLNLQDSLGNTPLHCAAAKGHSEIARALTNHGVSLDTKNHQGHTPLLTATLRGQTQLILAFLEECLTDIQASHQKNEPSLLHVATVRGHFEIARAFIQAKINLDEQDKNGNTPLHLAIIRKHKAIALMLIHAGANLDLINYDQCSPLLAATLLGNSELIHATMEKCIAALQRDNEQEITSLLHIAAERGHSEIVHAFIEASAPLEGKDSMGCTPLHLAAAYGHIDIVHDFIRANANLHQKNKDGYTPLGLATYCGRTDLITTFLEKCLHEIQAADEENQYSLFHIAASRGHLTIIHAFLRENANLEIKNQNNDTPLHFAASQGHTQVVLTLIQAGADLAAQTKSQFTPLHLAVIYNQQETVSLLIQMGADISAQSALTTLHHAIVKGHPEISEILLRNDTKTLHYKLSAPITDPDKTTLYPTGSSTLDVAKLSPQKIKLKKFIEISEALLAFQHQDLEKLVAHLEAQKEIDLKLLENDLLQTPFDRENLQNFAKQLRKLQFEHDATLNRNQRRSKLGLPLEKVTLQNSYKTLDLIFNIINNRLTGTLKDLCLRKLQLYFKHFNDPAETSTHNIDPAVKEKLTNTFQQNTEDLATHEALQLIFTSEIRSADKLFTKDPKDFLIEASKK